MKRSGFFDLLLEASVLTSDFITVCFNSLSGVGRRPIAHTCVKELHLSYCYNTYLEFVEEITYVLGDDRCWAMNSL